MRKCCEDCGEVFDAKRGTAKFCSDLCRVRAQRKGKSRPRPDEAGQPGLVESRVRADLAALLTAHPMGESLSAMSVTLARVLDNGQGLMGVAAINRELRENLAELTRLAVDDGDDLGDALSVPAVPAAVRDAPES